MQLYTLVLALYFSRANGKFYVYLFIDLFFKYARVRRERFCADLSSIQEGILDGLIIKVSGKENFAPWSLT